MSKDMMDTHAKVGAARARSEGRASDAEEELLVDENGDLLQADTQSKPLSVHEGSFADHDHFSCDSPEDMRADQGASEASAPLSPERASGHTGPQMWPARSKVNSTEHGEAIFLRLSNAADFINNSRARIEVMKLKKGAKYKQDTHIMWVSPTTLALVADEEQEASLL